jgi:hypothetical protein
MILRGRITELMDRLAFVETEHEKEKTRADACQLRLDEWAHEWKQLREHMGCDGSDLAQLMAAWDCLKGKMTFEKELERLINKHSQENQSNTPDFILASYIRGCLDAFNIAVQQRETWYGRDARPSASVPHTECSSCCEAPLDISGSNEGTNFYVCIKCGHPCEAVLKSK